MTKFGAKKSLGQHFLYNPATADHILNLAKIGPEDHVLEIGPGPGLLTERLAGRAARIVLVEKDHRFAEALKAKYKNLGDKFRIHEEDFLNTEIPALLPKLPEGRRWKVVANLPYNVATEITFRLLETRKNFSSFHLMFQKEVAERICSKPGSKTYGVLSIMTQIFSENKIVMRLKPGAFSPPPKVDSAIVQFTLRDTCRFSINHMETFQTAVRAAFGQRRKTIFNALQSGGWSKERITKALGDISPLARAETIAIEKFVEISNALAENTG